MIELKNNHPKDLAPIGFFPIGLYCSTWAPGAQNVDKVIEDVDANTVLDYMREIGDERDFYYVALSSAIKHVVYIRSEELFLVLYLRFPNNVCRLKYDTEMSTYRIIGGVLA